MSTIVASFEGSVPYRILWRSLVISIVNDCKLNKRLSKYQGDTWIFYLLSESQCKINNKARLEWISSCCFVSIIAKLVSQSRIGMLTDRTALYSAQVAKDKLKLCHRHWLHSELTFQVFTTSKRRQDRNFTWTDSGWHCCTLLQLHAEFVVLSKKSFVKFTFSKELLRSCHNVLSCYCHGIVTRGVMVVTMLMRSCGHSCHGF